MDADAKPSTVAELTRRGWRMAERTLASAATERTLVSHWFVTPDDDSIHTDEELGGDERTLTFLRVVIPTLAEQLAASIVAVAVPWNLGSVDGHPLLVLVALIHDQPAEAQARRLIGVAGTGPPWWSLSEDLMAIPRALGDVTGRLRI